MLRHGMMHGSVAIETRSLDAYGNAMNMYRNSNGKFNVNSNNRDNCNSEYGPREKFYKNARYYCGCSAIDLIQPFAIMEMTSSS